MNQHQKTNIKKTYDHQLSRNKDLIKSLTMLHSTPKIRHEIKALKHDNYSLKQQFRRDKLEVKRQIRKDLKQIQHTRTKLKKMLNTNRRTWDQATYDNKRDEYQQLVVERDVHKRKRLELIYGSAELRTKKDKMNRNVRFIMLLVLLILFFIPFWLVVTFSTKTNVEAAQTADFAVFVPSFSGGAEVNYALAMRNIDFWNSIVTTLVITIVSNVLIILFAAMAAWQLVRSQKWWSKVLFYMFIAAMILPFQAIMVPLISQMQQLGLRNSIIGTIISYIGFGMALSIFMMHGFLKTVPRVLEESAAVAGMGAVRIFVKVVLPLLRNTFITILVLNIMWIWNDYLLPSLMLSDQYGPQTLQVKLVAGLVNETSSDLKALSAGVIILLVPPIIYFTFSQRKMIAGITRGAIK